MYDVFNSPTKQITINGIIISGFREARGTASHNVTSGGQGSTDTYTQLSNANSIDDNNNQFENYVYHRITFSQALEVGDTFTLTDLDGNGEVKELGTIIGANNGDYVAPDFTQIGDALSEKKYDIKKNLLPSGFIDKDIKDIITWEANDENLPPNDADGSVTADFGADLVSDLYFLLALKDQKDDYAVEYSIDGCLEDLPGIASAAPPATDFGDADISYGVAEHLIVATPTTYLGSIPPDADAATQNSANGFINGIGDDSDGSDDEDAHNSLPILYTNDASYVIYTPCTGSATVAAWFDINHSGTFDSDERAEGVCNNASAELSWNGIASISQGITALRLRTASNSAEIALPTGTALDGEVEDYRVQIRKPNNTCENPVEITWAGAPNNAGTQTVWTDLSNDVIVNTTSSATGTSYKLVGSLDDPNNSLDLVMSKTDGVYGTGYLTMFKSDDNGASNDRGDTGAFTFSFDKPVYLSTWRVDDIDENGAQFQDVVELTAQDANGADVPLTMINVGSSISQSGQTATANIGAGGVSETNAVAQASWTSNFAINTLKLDYISGLNARNPTTQAIRVPGFFYCEIEFDFGDAPTPYPQASHIYTELPILWLGTIAPDKENDMLAGNGAIGDDLDGTADEDSISTFPVLKDSDGAYSVDVIVNNVTGETANLVGWIDFDKNNKFDSDEAVSVPVLNGSADLVVTLNWDNVPSDIQAGSTYARFRLTTDSAIATGAAISSSPDGTALDGEVEDYALTIEVGGYNVGGTVYEDIDVNGSYDNAETGIEGVSVVLMKIEADPANNTCISTKTDASGNYLFSTVQPGDYQLYEAANETIATPQNCDATTATDPINYRSTTPNGLSTFSVIDTEVKDKDFGDVKLPTFSPNNSGQILPGNVVFYSHIFTAPADGDITFSNAVSQQVSPGWANLLYQDTNCNGVLDGTEGASPIKISGTKTVIPVTAANPKVCIINKVFAPSNVAANDRQLQTITATFDYNNAIAGTVDISVTDLSTAGQVQTPGTAASPEVGASALELKKTVQNISQGTPPTTTSNGAKPGEMLRYIVYYRNTGTGAISDLTVNDNVPDYTTLQANSVACSLTPTALGTCSHNINGENLSWDFTGLLDGGAQGHVTFVVKVDQ